MAGNDDPPQVRRRIRISGVVQGVGFRYFVLREARSLGVDGWVKNLPDGAVLCEAQTSVEIMESFVAHLRRGPRFSRVEGLDAEELEPEEGADVGFAIR